MALPLVDDAARIWQGARTASNPLDSLYRMLFGQACFVAGTPLLTPDGAKPIEAFRVGDRILSRPEGDCEAPVAVQFVEETFVRTAPIWALTVGGRNIRTTAEHPFYVPGQGLDQLSPAEF